jgi:uncharacterized membrane protein
MKLYHIQDRLAQMSQNLCKIRLNIYLVLFCQSVFVFSWKYKEILIIIFENLINLLKYKPYN